MEIIAQLPPGMNRVDYAFHPANPNRIPEMGRKLFELLYDLTKRFGHAYAKQDWLAWRLEVSESYIEKLVSRLNAELLIRVEKHSNNFYWVLEYFSDPTEPVVEKVKPPKKDPPRAKQAKTEPRASELEAKRNLEVGTKPATVELSEAEVAASEAARREAEEALLAEPVVAPEIAEAVEDAVQQVGKEYKAKYFYKPKAINGYLEEVKQRLMAWEINAPGRLIGDMVLAYWQSWR